ncbi:hypothetical protein Mucpa_3001 [Mucilaginibacter paludis DSM 18603]|uniref:Uncharacterized protein n=1 Tax=Mucilaginibacter paludis DSM 18603 TaxID=714943 RepID=H1YD82_9SPHI|nr:hypothetical protein Mucpa_3001 [Mucilaginibacter paludis DSM 18603]
MSYEEKSSASNKSIVQVLQHTKHAQKVPPLSE